MNIALALVVVGTISQYAPGRMEEVIAVRQAHRTAHHLPQNLPSTDGYAAIQDCDRIGEVFYIRSPKSGEWESFLAVDCGGGADGGAEWMRRNNVLAEVDYGTAARWGVVGRGVKCEVYWASVSARLTPAGF